MIHRATCCTNNNLLSLTVINMENDNSQSPKKNILSGIVQPIRRLFNDSEGSQGRSKSLRRELFGKFRTTSPRQSTLSLPLISSGENSGRETSLGKFCIFAMYMLNCNPIADFSTVTAPDGMPPNRSSVTPDSSQYPDHRTPPESFGSHPLATSPVVQSE